MKIKANRIYMFIEEKVCVQQDSNLYGASSKVVPTGSQNQHVYRFRHVRKVKVRVEVAWNCLGTGHLYFFQGFRDAYAVIREFESD